LKRSAFDVIRRGFDNALANWPLILIRIGEGVVFGGIIVAAIFAAVIPILVSAGLSKDVDYSNPENVAHLFATLIIEHWVLLLYLLALAFVIVGVLIAVHSFVEAGCARVYVDGERAPAMRVFDFGRWWRGGAAGWWRVFWIYNVAWSFGCLVLLVPLVLTIAALLLIDDVRGRIAVGCSGLGFTFLLFMPTAILVGIWVHKAIADAVARGLGAVEALGAARREFRLDFGRHLAVGIVMMIISFMAAAVVSGVGFPLSGFGNHGRGDLSVMLLLFAPMQLVMTFVQGVLSSAVSSWTLASFVSLAEER
jgi:hypothetical protein